MKNKKEVESYLTLTERDNNKSQLAREAEYYLETAALKRAIDRMKDSLHQLDRIDVWTFERMLRRYSESAVAGTEQPPRGGVTRGTNT